MQSLLKLEREDQRDSVLPPVEGGGGATKSSQISPLIEEEAPFLNM
jgi:hypothetical protein